MRKILFSFLAIILLFCMNIFGKAKYSDYAKKGGKNVQVSSTNYKLMETYPSCTITVYFTGTTTLAPIYANSAGSTKSNPFTADSNAYYEFYADDGRYDIRFSGTGIAAPFTKADIILYDSAAAALSASLIVNPYQFGAFGDGNSHPISSQDITNHPEWKGMSTPTPYSAGWEWDTVAIQECLYAAYGTGVPARWTTNPQTIRLNKEVYLANGKFLINHGLHSNAITGVNIHGIRKATTLVWTGTNPNENMWSFDGIDYGQIGEFSLEASAPNNECLLDLDYSGTFTGILKQQQLTLHGFDVIGNNIAKRGWCLNRASSSSGQGDTIQVNNVLESSFTFAGAELHGFNILEFTVNGGDNQGNSLYGFYLNGAAVTFINKGWQNGTKIQIDNKGADIFTDANSGTPIIVNGGTSESAEIGNGSMLLKNVITRPAFNGVWIANSNYVQSTVLTDPHSFFAPQSDGQGREWINTSANPTLGNYSNIQSPFSTTIITDNINTYVVNVLIGKPLNVIYPNCFQVTTSPVISNTAHTITIPALPFTPADVSPAQGCGLHTTYAIYSGPYPKTAGVEPTWNNVPTSVYFSGLGNGDPGFDTTASSNSIVINGGSNTGKISGALIGQTILLTKASATGGDFFTTITAAPDFKTLTLTDVVPLTVINATARISNLLVDGTVNWMPYEFYSTFNVNDIRESTLRNGRVYANAPAKFIDNNFTRFDWLHPDVLTLGTGRITDIGNSPNSFLYGKSGFGFTIYRQGLLLGTFTLAEITAMIDLKNFTQLNCSDCTAGSNPCTNAGTGAIMKKLNNVLTCN